VRRPAAAGLLAAHLAQRHWGKTAGQVMERHAHQDSLLRGAGDATLDESVDVAVNGPRLITTAD